MLDNIAYILIVIIYVVYEIYMCVYLCMNIYLYFILLFFMLLFIFLFYVSYIYVGGRILWMNGICQKRGSKREICCDDVRVNVC